MWMYEGGVASSGCRVLDGMNDSVGYNSCQILIRHRFIYIFLVKFIHFIRETKDRKK